MNQKIKMSDIRAQFPMYSDLSDQQLLIGLRKQYYSDMKPGEFYGRIDFDTERERLQKENVEGMGTAGRFIAGMGQGVAKLGRAAGQAFGLVSQDDIDEAAKIDAPLTNTTAGKVGSVAGQVAATVPVAMLPGANTVAGAALYGAGVGGLTTEGGLGDRALGATLGAAGGAAGQWAGQKISQAVASRAASKPAEWANNAARNATIKELQQSGYVLPPSAARPTLTNQVMEGFGGKVLTQQKASQANQAVTNTLARKALGLSDEVPITPETLGSLRAQAGEAYKTLAGQGTIQMDDQLHAALRALKAPNERMAQQFPSLVKKDIDAVVEPLLKSSEIDADLAVEAIKGFRHESRALLNAFDDPAKQAAGKAYKTVADELENLLERRLTEAGAPGAVKAFRDARQLIAKSYTVEDALNIGTGNISAQKLAKALEKGSPLTGELKKVAKMGQAFPKAAQEVDKVGSVNAVNPLELYATGAGALVSPYALAIPATRIGARSLSLSPLVQSRLASAPTSRGLLDQALPLTAGAARRMLPGMGLLSGASMVDD